MLRFLVPALFAGLATGALAAPTLRPEVNVVAPIVTVGDMFADAGEMAATPLFRAPLPGTTGVVGLDDIDAAAARIGFSGYGFGAVDKVRVTRDGIRFDAQDLAALVSDAIVAEGLAPLRTVIDVRLSQPDLVLAAAVADEPVRLIDLDYRAGASGFTARLEVAGTDLPVEISGRVSFFVEAPHLVSSVRAGDVLEAGDIEMRLVNADLADRAGVAQIEQLVGKAIKRNARDGLMLRVADVAEPLAVRRNQQVTVHVKAGAMVLSMQGQALGDGAIGAPVRVMNPVSNKILSGVVSAAGTVEIAPGGYAVAGL